MAKRIRVVSADSLPAEKVTGRIVKASENPAVPKLTENEIKARMVRKYSTTTSFRSRSSADVIDSGTSQFYSPQLSTDFLEKPQNQREQRAFCRFFYNTNEIVGQAIDIHSTLPLSKLRLVPPKGSNQQQNEYVMRFFENMCDDLKLFRGLIDVSHEFHLFGNCHIFMEENDLTDIEDEIEAATKKDEAAQRSEYLKTKFNVVDKNPLYKGWKKLIILPPDQVRIRKLPLSDDLAVEYVPDAQTKEFIVHGGFVGRSGGMVEDDRDKKYDVPAELKDKVRMSGVIPLDTDPYTGSFCFTLSRKKSQYDPLGKSVIERCINTLVLLDKLRQAQTSIASRHMTPMRIIWAEGLNSELVDDLRAQVDLALVDPDYSIIANYDIHWEEMGSNTRLLDLSSEYEMGTQRLLAGLGMTKEILTGEGSYSGSRISLEIMNTQYLLFREIMQDFVENYLFKPVAKKKGFVDYDQFGNEILLYPKLSFTRLAIRDNDKFFDAAFQLYQKGSISVDLILEILNIDPISTKEKIEKDMFTVNDSIFNELLRNIYTTASAPLVEQTDLVEKLAKYMNLTVKPGEEPPPAGAQRFSSEQKDNKELIPEDKDKVVKMARIMKYLQSNPELLEKVFSNVEKRDQQN